MGLSNLQLHLANLRAAACFFSHYARATLNNTSAGLYILSRHPPRCITCEKRSHVGDVFWRAHAIEGRQTCAESAVLLRHHVVSVNPGDRMFTVTLPGPSSTARERANCSIAPLLPR